MLWVYADFLQDRPRVEAGSAFVGFMDLKISRIIDIIFWFFNVVGDTRGRIWSG